MVDTWHRNLTVGQIYDRWFYFDMRPVQVGQSLLRLYVSWHVVGLHLAATEPLFTGIELRRSTAGPPSPPPDPMEATFSLPGEWLAAEMHGPSDAQAGGESASRLVWPRDGHRIWDIKANRKAGQDEQIVPFFVYALPQGSRGTVAPRLHYSMLLRIPP